MHHCDALRSTLFALIHVLSYARGTRHVTLARYTIETTEAVQHNGVPTGELSISLSVSYGKSVAAGLMNHKQAIAATPKHAKRERGLSLVTTDLPGTVKLLIASLDKTSSALIVKYANRQRDSGAAAGGGGGAGSPAKVARAASITSNTESSSLAGVGRIGRGTPGETVDELDLFVDSLGVIVDRLRTRIKARPDKVNLNCHNIPHYDVYN